MATKKETRPYLQGLNEQVRTMDERQNEVRREIESRQKAAEVIRYKQMTVHVDADVYKQVNDMVSTINSCRRRGDLVSNDLIIYNAVVEYLANHRGEVSEKADIASLLNYRTPTQEEREELRMYGVAGLRN